MSNIFNYDGFNHDFSEEVPFFFSAFVPFRLIFRQDQETLIRYGTLPADQRPYICGWVVEDRPCGIPVLGDQFSMHLRDYHGVTGADKIRMRCCWVRCGTSMNKESMVRHVEEMHLQLRYTCTLCGEGFSRRSTMTSHFKKH